jgi:hypothetical protein
MVRQPIEVQVLLSPSQESATRSSSVRVIMKQCSSYVKCHEKVVKSFKARPPELVVLGPSVFSHQHGRLAAKGHGGAINPSCWFLVVASLAREGLEAVFGSSSVVFPMSHVRWCFLCCFSRSAL